MTSQISTPPFVHLHVHTHFSLLDGANRIDELIQSAKQMGMPAIAITDHGNMFGAIEFYQTAIKAGIRPIIGMEAYIAPGDRREKGGGDAKAASYHLLLLAMNEIGYHNLIKLTSIGYREGFYYKPRIDREVLEAHNEGLICTSTCLGAEIPQSLMRHDRTAAERTAEWYLKVFGTERFFIELQDHGMEEQRMINPELTDIANRLGVGQIVTNDVHYLTHDDVEAHDVLCCISTRALQSDNDRFRFPSDQFYLKSPDEMQKLFPNLPEAMSNTVAIAERCCVELDFKKRYTPVYPLHDEKTPEDYLRQLVYEGSRDRYGELTNEIRERIDYELEIIQSKGFSSYFLICWDFVHYARSQGIPCGARGSGCSSVVAYCLHLSQPDPLKYGLYFERFMDPDRHEMPDLDIDMCQDGRERVIQYVREKYGHVAQIITFGTLKARAVIRDVCRVLDVPLAEADRIAKLVPEELNMTLDRALDQEPELKQLYDEDPRICKVIEIGKRLEGLSRNASVHAAGVVIAEQPLDDLLPLYQPPGSESVITQFEGPIVEKVGLLKMDFLGLKTLSVLSRTCTLIRENHGVEIDLEKLDLTDQKVFHLFRKGLTSGVFQFESGGMRNVLLKMGPTRIDDLIAANALFRPGPMVNIDAYVARKHGEKWSTPHPIMDEVLEETYGIIVYQEQVARLVNQLGDIERKRAFRLAKAISKKKRDLIEAEREPFLDGAGAHGVKRAVAEDIFNQIIPFGEYAFNKAHATGYSLIAYQTAFLKSYYPLEFMAAVLTYEMGDTDKVVKYIEECNRLKIEVKSPDINTSHVDFTAVYPGNDEDGYLCFGLAAIKGVGEKAVRCIAQTREKDGPFKDLYDFCERIDLSMVNRGVCEAMIKAGAFDSTGAMRKALMNVLDKALQIGMETQRDRAIGQMTMFESFSEAGDPDSHPAISTEEWSDTEMLAQEKSVLGFYVTRHPLMGHEDTLRKYTTADCADFGDLKDGTQVVMGGMISRLRMATTRRGRNAGAKLAILTLEDLTGSIEAVVFSETLEQYGDRIGPDKLVFLKGLVDCRREVPSLRTNEVISLEEGPAQLAKALILKIKTDTADSQSMGKLCDICKSYPGKRAFFLRVQSPDQMTTLIRCDSKMAVHPSSEFIRQVEDLLGPCSVELLGGRRKMIRRAAPESKSTPIATRSDSPMETVIPS